MRPLSLRFAAAILLLAAASPSRAEQACEPAPPAASSAKWGDNTALRKKADEVFGKLLAEARKGVDIGGKKVAYAGDVFFNVDLEHAVIGGSPAAAFQAGVGLNKTGRFSGKDLVFAGGMLFENADPDEAAMTLAHEMGHLAYGHPKAVDLKKLEIVDALFAEWENAHQKEVQTIDASRDYATDEQRAEAKVKLYVKDSTPKIEAELAKLQAPMEEAADVYGRALLIQAGYPGQAAVTAFLRFGHRIGNLPDPVHGGTVNDRALKHEEDLAAREAARQRADIAIRRAKCAAEGTSCE